MSATFESSRTARSLGRLGRYELRAELASGGMATVYLAELHGPHGFEKTVAVKRIHPHLARDRRFVEMFLDEARLAARIHHPNVCAIVDFGEEDGTPYLVMEHLAGEPLSVVMKRIRALGATPHWLPARIVHDAALGLSAAHRLRGPDGELVGVVHRDVSPQNIFVLFDGLTKVVDFGIARARGRLTTTRTNEIKGKLGYMAPEQIDQKAIDPRTDVWALGVVLWEATVGKRLFRGDNDGATLNLVLEKPIPRPSERCGDYPERLEAIVMRCLERDPARRYSTAEELAADLDELLYAMGKPAGASQVRRWMEAELGDRMAAQEALLRGSPLERRDDFDSETTQTSRRARKEQGEPERETTVRAPAGGARAAGTEPGPRTSRWTPLLWMAGGALLVLGLVSLGERRDEAAPVPVAAPVPPAASAPVVPAPIAEPAEPRPARPPAREDAIPPEDEPETAAPAATRPEPLAPSTPRARRIERPRAAAPEAAAPGRLSLIAIPSATVRAGGRSLGVTPLVNVPLPAGTHRLELRGENGRTKVVTVRIASDETTRMRVEL